MGFCNSISSVAPDGPNDEPTVRSKPKKRGWGLKKKESGRLEGPAPSGDKAPSRDGLHSAPSGDAAAKQEQMRSPSKVVDRGGLHSAPPDRKSAPAVASEGLLPKPETLSEFLVEGVSGVGAADADAYCADVFGPTLVKELRAPEWATRVRGLEAVQALINSRLGCECVGLAAAGRAEQLALFKAGVTVLARLEQDKVVPVYLPALQLLDQLFAPSTTGGLPASLLRAALDVLAPQLVTRAGSSNVRAREDSTKVLLRLARSPHVGGAAVGLHALRPLPNSKSQHAALGRLELLAGVVSGCGLGARGVPALGACDFVVPLCDAPSEKIRETAMGLLARLHALAPAEVLAHVAKLKPSLAQALTISAGPGAGGGSGAAGPLGPAASGRTKLAPLARISGPAGPTRPAAGREAGGAPVADEPPPATFFYCPLPATHTPPQVDARARARKTAAELGAREPPPAPSAPAAPQQKKRLRHPTYKVDVENDHGNEQLERTPTPAPGQGRTPMKGRDAYAGRGLFDELEEGLMESILDAEAEPSPR